MKIAFLYAGQGSQKVGMGKDFYEAYPLFKETMDALPDAETIKEVSFYGPEEELSRTVNTQPCMVAFAVGVTKLLEYAGIHPDAVAGLSLGEYSALAAANVLSDAETVQLVQFRAKAMEESAEGVDSAMAAVLNADIDLLEKVCQECADVGVVEIANINCPGQVVLSGQKAALEKAEVLLNEAGIKKVVFLDVNGPFHTSFMKSAGNQLREEMKTYRFKEMQIPVVFNRTGSFLAENEDIPTLLEEQVQNSVLFDETIHTLKDFGIDTIIEIGPGKALSGFVKRTHREIPCYPIGDVESFEKAVKEVGERQ